MEMLYFTLGVLMVIALFLIGVVIVGMVKVLKIQKEIIDLKEQFRWESENQNRRFYDEHRDLNQRFDSFYRDLDKLHQECTSYTDKRIDKVVYQYKEKEN